MKIKINKNRKRWISRVLVVAMLLHCIPVSADQKAKAVEDTGFQSTEYGVQDDRVIAHRLVLSDNEEVIDTGLMDVVLVKETMDEKRVRVHIYGVKGLIHTYELEADNEWIREAEEGYVKISRVSSGGLGKTKLYVITNPNTGKTDVINVAKSKYYSYGLDSLGDISAVGNNEYCGLKGDDFTSCFYNPREDEKIVWYGYRKNKKIGIADTTGKKVTEAEYDECTFKNGAVLLGKKQMDEYGNYNEREWRLLKSNGEYGGKYISIDINYEQPWMYAEKEDGTKGCVNIITGKEYGFDNYSFWGKYEMREYMLVMKEREDYYKADAWTYNDYLSISADGGVVSLKKKLGVDAIKIDGQRTTEDSVYVKGYNVLSRDIYGNVSTEYAFRGYVGKDGEIIYGYDTNVELNWDAIWWNGDYGIIKNCQNNNSGSSKTQYKVIDKQGKEIYEYTDKIVNAYKTTEGTSVKNYGNEYLVFEIDGKKVTLDLEKKSLLPNYNLYSIDYSRPTISAKEYSDYFWQTKEGKFIIIENEEKSKYGILNTDNGKKYFFDFSIFSIPGIEVFEDSKGRTLIKAENVFVDKEINLDANLERLNIPSSYDSGDGSQILGDCIYNKNGIVYDFLGKELLKNTYARDSDSNMYNIHHMMPVYQDEYEWTYCDAKGNILFDYNYHSVSEFVGGIAWGSSRWDEDAEVFDYSGNILVHFAEPYLDGLYNRYHIGNQRLPELYGEGIILHEGGLNVYFYDLSNITMGNGGTQDNIVASQDKDRNALLENAEEMGDFTFSGVKTQFTLPDEVPVLGGEEISLDFSMIPIVAQKSGNTFRIGLGLEEEDGEKVGLFKHSIWKDYKNIVEEQKLDIEKGFSLWKNADILNKFAEGEVVSVSAPLTKKVKSKVYGYLEGTVGNGQIESFSGRLVMEMKASASKKWQTVVVSVPVVLSAKGEVGITADYALIADLQEGTVTVKGEGTVDLILPSITLSAGVGVAYIADVSVYGKMTNTLEIEMQAQEDVDFRVRDYIDGEMGVSVSLLLASYEKSLLKAKRKMVYDSNNGVVTSKKSNKKLAAEEDAYKIQRDYANETSGWQMSKEENSGAAMKMQILQEDVYGQANPQIVCDDNGTKIMTFITDVESRSTGNHTAVAYSLYDEQSRRWSEPVLVDEDGTADMYSQLATDGEKIYLVWVDAKRNDFTENASVGEMAKECEITVGVFDPLEKKFKNITTLTDDAHADICPSLFVDNGMAYISWIANLENDLIGMTGTNVIKYATNSSGIWETKDYHTLEVPVTTTQIGKFQDDISIAYLSDVDSNITTSNDLEAYVGTLDGKIKKIATEKAGKQTLQFIKLGNKDVLAFSSSEGFWYTDDMEEYKCLFANEAQSNMKYECIHGESSDLLICSEAGESGVNLHGYLYKNGTMSSEIPITAQNQHIQQPSGFYNNGNYYFVFTRITTDISEDDVSLATDICAMEFNEYQDLKAKELFVAEESVVPGKTGELQITVTNNGFHDEKNFIVYVYAGEIELGSYTCEENLAIGETKNIVVGFDVPENFLAETKISCKVKAQGDINANNDTLEAVIGKTNVSLEVFSKENNDGQTEGVVYITNTSGYLAEPTLKIYEGSKDGKLLKTESLGQIAAGEVKRIKYSSNEIAELAEDGTTLYFEVSIDGKEQYLLDNYGYLYISHTGSMPTPAPGSDIIGTIYTWQGRFTGWGGPNSYPSSVGHEQGTGEANVTYINLTNMRISCGYECGLEFMNPYNPDFTGEKNEMAQFIKEMKNPRIRVTLQNGGVASSWNWDTELSFSSGKEVALPDGYLDNEYFVLFGNDDVITKVEIYDVGQGGSQTTVTSKPVVTPSPSSPTSKPSNKPKATPTKRKLIKAPSRVKVKKIKRSGKGCIKVTWKKVKCNEGYQVQYSRKRNFSKKATRNAKGSSIYIYGKRKKVYYVRVRAVNWGWKTQSKRGFKYGKWSKVKKIRVQ